MTLIDFIWLYLAVVVYSPSSSYQIINRYRTPHWNTTLPLKAGATVSRQLSGLWAALTDRWLFMSIGSMMIHNKKWLVPFVSTEIQLSFGYICIVLLKAPDKKRHRYFCWIKPISPRLSSRWLWPSLDSFPTKSACAHRRVCESDSKASASSHVHCIHSLWQRIEKRKKKCCGTHCWRSLQGAFVIKTHAEAHRQALIPPPLIASVLWWCEGGVAAWGAPLVGEAKGDSSLVLADIFLALLFLLCSVFLPPKV